MLTKETLEFVEHVNLIESERELIARFEVFLKRLGVYQYCVSEVRGISSDTAAEFGTWNKEWGKRYKRHNYYKQDPVILRAQSHPGSFYWSREHDREGVKSPSRKVLDEAGEFGVTDGYTVPVFRANGYLAVASFSLDDGPPDDTLRMALELATVYFHAKLLAFRETELTSTTALSIRERECLQWAAEGKSDWEIGKILNISKTTVHSHIEKAKARYGVPTRVQAVVTALRNRELRL